MTSNHLSKLTLDVVNNFTDEERIFFTKKAFWIKYTKAEEIIEEMEGLLTYPQRGRMPNFLIFGDSNNGKTALIERFCNSNKSYFDEERNKSICPVVSVQAPPEPDERDFYDMILDKLFAPTKITEKVGVKRRRTINLLEHLEVKVLIIDEIHHILTGTLSKRKIFLNAIKFLSNDSKISIICAGTREAFNVLQSDDQNANRFVPRSLPRWKNDMEFRRLLISFERKLPLKKPSYLIENSMVAKILSMSDGLIGEVAKILELSTIMAIKEGREKINHQILDSINFISPTDRKKIQKYL